MAGHLAWGVALEERPYDECHLVSEYRRREEERGKRGGGGGPGEMVEYVPPIAQALQHRGHLLFTKRVKLQGPGLGAVSNLQHEKLSQAF